jgi:hypothetical protein
MGLAVDFLSLAQRLCPVGPLVDLAGVLAVFEALLLIF